MPSGSRIVLICHDWKLISRQSSKGFADKRKTFLVANLPGRKQAFSREKCCQSDRMYVFGWQNYLKVFWRAPGKVGCSKQKVQRSRISVFFLRPTVACIDAESVKVSVLIQALFGCYFCGKSFNEMGALSVQSHDKSIDYKTKAIRAKKLCQRGL